MGYLHGEPIMRNATFSVVVCFFLMFTLGGEAEIGSMTVTAKGVTVTDISLKANGVTQLLKLR